MGGMTVSWLLGIVIAILIIVLLIKLIRRV